MNTTDALKILGIEGDYTPETVKKAYRKACALYHPDRNAGGLEMMKLVNQAYEALKNQTGKAERYDNIADKLIEALNAIIGLGLSIELCGTWIWVSGNTKEHKEALKSAGFKWASKKLMWYFHADERTRWTKKGGKDINDIRLKYGSKIVTGARSYRTALPA